ncbi:MAG: sensor histidine kinase [Candidatus Binataceae bacterium]
MNRASKSEVNSHRCAGRPAAAGSPAKRIEAIAKLGAALAGGGLCAIGWSTGGRNGVAISPTSDSRLIGIARAALDALDNRLACDAAATNGSIAKIQLSNRELGAIADEKIVEEAGVQIAAAGFYAADGTVRVAWISPMARPHEEIEAALEIAGGATLSEIAAATECGAHRYWRLRAADAGARIAAAKRELAGMRAEMAALDAAAARARRFPPRERMARFGALVAKAAACDDWVAAIADGGTLRIAAAADGLSVPGSPAPDGALAECFRAQSATECANGAGRSDYPEAKIFRGPFVCLPFSTGAIALGGRGAAAPGARARAEALVRRFDPIVRMWALEAEAEQRSTLVNRLALRMFNAIDEERARIARDLHDDQAQLLAAAKIALAGGREEARAILHRVEDELRRKTRELRPAALGHNSLGEAIAREFERLERAGVKARLSAGSAAATIPRAIQQVCFQVVREALSNVIRHARAKSVEVAIEFRNGAARIAISDDGRGLRPATPREGGGLAGIRERLELMGGRLQIESKPGGMTAAAEIPAPHP